MSRDFGEWMRNHRLKKSMSQTRLAQAVGVHANTIIRWESGTQFPTLDMAERVIEVLGSELVIVN